MTIDVTVEPLSEDALLLRFGDAIDPAINARVHAAARALRDADLPGIRDVAPAYASLMLRFDPRAWMGDDAADEPYPRRLTERLRVALKDTPKMDPGLRRDDEQRARDIGDHAVHTIEIPVCYGGDCGPDLDAVATHAGLSQAEVIARHLAGEYTVAMLGFAPGFPYLLGLDETLRMPRRADPRTRVPTGSVAIGGAQTGIYPRELPGGWHLIGRTPLTLFDPQCDPPALLAPGDRVRFRTIGADDFARLAEQGT